MILRKKRKQFEAPSEGIHLGVLADVEKLPKLTPWGQEQVRFRWFVEQVGKDGKQLSVIATYYASRLEADRQRVIESASRQRKIAAGAI